MNKNKFLFTLVLSLLFAANSMADDIHLDHWVSDMPNKMRITQLSIPKAHDAATHASNSEWFEDQDKDEKTCFENGVRAFDLRIGKMPALAVDPTFNGGGYFYHAFNPMHSFKEEIEEHMPTPEQLFATNVKGIKEEERGEFMILDISGEHMYGSDEANYEYRNRQIFANLLNLLIDKYCDENRPKEQVFIPFDKDLTLEQMRGKIIIIANNFYAKKDSAGLNYKECKLYEGEEGWHDVYVPISCTTFGKNGLYSNLKDVGSDSDFKGIIRSSKILSFTGDEKNGFPTLPLTGETKPGDPRVAGEIVSQQYFEPNRSAQQMSDYYKWTRAYFDNKIDNLNTQNIFMDTHLNGFTYFAGGLGTAADFKILFGAKTLITGANHLTHDFLKQVRKPLGIIGMDFCGSDEVNINLLSYIQSFEWPAFPYFKSWGLELTTEIVRHNYYTKNILISQEWGYISDIMICTVPRNHTDDQQWKDGEVARQALEERGYTICMDIRTDDLLAGYDKTKENEKIDKEWGAYRIYFGVKRTFDPDSALNRIILIKDEPNTNGYLKLLEKVKNLREDEPFTLDDNLSEAEKEEWNYAFWGSYYYKPVKVLDLTGGGNRYGDLRGGLLNNQIHIFLWQEKNPTNDKKLPLLINFTKNYQQKKDGYSHFCHRLDIGWDEENEKWKIKQYDGDNPNNSLNITSEEHKPNNYISVLNHDHFVSKDYMGFDDKSHYLHCTTCNKIFDREDHDFSYLPSPTLIYHRAVCNKCGYGRVEYCIRDVQQDFKQDNDYPYDYEFGIGKCGRCDTIAYQPAKLRDDGVYEISNEGQLHWFSRMVAYEDQNLNAELTNNISLTRSFLPIGMLSKSAEKRYVQNGGTGLMKGLGYKGTFDGKGHYLDNMNLDKNLLLSSEAMFSLIDGGTVKNLGLKDFSAQTGKPIAASFAGHAKDAVFENIYSHQADITSTPNDDFPYSVSAGMVGRMSNCVLKNGYFTGDLETTDENGKFTKYAVGIWSDENVTDGDALLASSVSNFYCLNKDTEGVLASYADSLKINIKSYDDFKSGKVCYLLNHADGAKNNTWFQRIATKAEVVDTDPFDIFPVLRPKEGNEDSYIVYGGYKHGETDVFTISNSSDISGHSHIYDEEADTEAEGNHDKSYVQIEEHPTYRLDVESGKAFAQWNLKCSICNKELPPVEVEATKTEGETDVEPTCTLSGLRYLSSTYKLRDNTVFTDSYHCDAPPLGHDFSGKILSDEPKHYNAPDHGLSGDLYSYVCSRDGALSDIKVIKDYSSEGNLELSRKNYVWSTSTDIHLTDDNQFKGISFADISTPNYPTYTRTMKNQWGTFCAPFGFEIDESQPYEFYYITSITDNTLTLKKATNAKQISQFFCLIRVNREEVDGKEYRLVLTSKEKRIHVNSNVTEQNKLDGLYRIECYEKKDLTDEDGYIIANNKFWNIHDLVYDEDGKRRTTADGKAVSVTCLPFHGYLGADKPSDAKVLNFSFSDDESSAIETINALTSGEAEYYDMNGRRISDLQHGVNIVKYGNGVTKKVILK